MDDASNRTFYVDLTHALPAPIDKVLPANVVAQNAIRMRVANVVPYNLDEKEALCLSMAAALRNPKCAIGVLFGERLLRNVGMVAINDLAIRDDEYGALLAALPPHTSTDPFDALECKRGVQSDTADALAAACQTTMLSDALRVAWRRSVVRTAACVALRSENAVPMLAAVIGESSRSDARRIDTLLSDLQDTEEENDEHLLPTCLAVEALAAALALH